MEDLLQNLERRIRDLVAQQDRLKQSNQELFHGKSELVREKNLLLAKNQKAINQIESLVNRLRTIESTI